MNTIRFIAAAVFALVSSTLFAQQKETSFKVSGNCSMCKKRIESAANVPGVASFGWNVKTKTATVAYDPGKISIGDIQKKIAEAGHDSEITRADNKSYNNLPPCCRYPRESHLPTPIKN